MPLLIDFGDLPDDCCTDALEELAKATSYGEASHLYDRLPNRWAADHAEAVSARLSAIIEQMRNVLMRFLSGHPEDLRKADMPWVRMAPERFEQARNRLEFMNPATMTLADYEMLVEWIIARYLPDDVIQTEAQYIAVRAALLGKIESNLSIDRRVTDPMIHRIVELLPTDFAHVPPHVFTPLEASMMDYGMARGAEAIRGVAESIRHRMNLLVMRHVQAGVLGQKEGTTKHLQTALFDQFSSQNRDFRRVSITEVGEIHNQAYVASLQPGQKVKRIEAYANACEFCASINGKIFNVVSPDDPRKNWDTDIWVGKDQLGRSASPMKRVGDRLVERPSDEMWTVTAGLIHPNCRGAWLPVTDRPPQVSEEFFALLSGVLDKV